MGSNNEQERVLLEHLPIVRFLARRIHERLPQHVDIEDLVSAGVVGLMDAFTKFDPAKEGAIPQLRAVPHPGRDSGQPAHAGLEPARAAAQGPRGRGGDSHADCAAGPCARRERRLPREMGLGLEEYQQLLGDLKGLEIGTLHVEHNEDSGEEELAYIPGRPEDDPLFRCLRGEMQERLAEAIEHLPERERLVMTLYYYEEMTMREIGLALGVVESRVSQMHASAVVHLRAELRGLAARNESAEARARGRPDRADWLPERSKTQGGRVKTRGGKLTMDKS